MLSSRTAVFLLALSAFAQQVSQAPSHAAIPSGNRNDPAEVEKFRDRGFGLFIHWGVDGPLGGVISHSLVGASPDFVERYFRTLPGYFNPDRYEPAKWASLAKLAGF